MVPDNIFDNSVLESLISIFKFPFSKIILFNKSVSTSSILFSILNISILFITISSIKLLLPISRFNILSLKCKFELFTLSIIDEIKDSFIFTVLPIICNEVSILLTITSKFMISTIFPISSFDIFVI